MKTFELFSLTTILIVWSNGGIDFEKLGDIYGKCLNLCASLLRRICAIFHIFWDRKWESLGKVKKKVEALYENHFYIKIGQAQISKMRELANLIVSSQSSSDPRKLLDLSAATQQRMIDGLKRF